MEQIYWNLILLLILILCIIWIHYFSFKSELFLSINDFAQIPYMYMPHLFYFNNIPSGYDSSTRSYYNPYFAQQVAQGLDTD